MKNEQGNRYGRLVVLSYIGVNKRREVQWLCRCDCGIKKVIRGNNLRSGRTQSCGCLQRDIASTNCGENNPNFKHGLVGTKEYVNMQASKHRALKRNQTPELTDNEKDKVIFYYQVSQQLGDGWHVDYIIPLSKSGLHHPDNLQVVTKKYNNTKYNKLNFREPTALECWRI